MKNEYLIQQIKANDYGNQLKALGTIAMLLQSAESFFYFQEEYDKFNESITK